MAGINISVRQSSKDIPKNTGENLNSSESYKQSVNHDFVMQRESMIFRTIPNRNNEEEKKQSFSKKMIQTNDGASMSNSIAIADYPEHPNSEFNVR
jgi:hypothetical protein